MCCGDVRITSTRVNNICNNDCNIMVSSLCLLRAFVTFSCIITCTESSAEHSFRAARDVCITSKICISCSSNELHEEKSGSQSLMVIFLFHKKISETVFTCSLAGVV